MDEAKPRHWFIQKPVSNNVPNTTNGAVFQEFMPTVSERNCEWIKVYSADDLHKILGMGLTRYVNIMVENARNQDEIARLNVNIRGAMEALDSLRAENQKLREALEDIRRRQAILFDDPMTSTTWRIANDALEAKP